MNGILPLWKPKGMTSHDCVLKARKLLKTKKIGHTGTLDPEVEGVLPLCIGEATKIVPFLTDTQKTYVATMTLGYSTDTEDHTGEVVYQKSLPTPIPEKTLMEILNTFNGKIVQTVPLYSAIKVDGKKLYEYAREGIEVERPSRMIEIYGIEFIDTTFDHDKKLQHVTFEVKCSKGTYIRTLCKDLGEKLDFPAHMSGLERTATGGIIADQCVRFDDMMSQPTETLLLPIKKGISHLDKLDVSETTRTKVLNGQKLPLPVTLPETEYFRIECDGELLAIYHVHDNNKEIKPARVFNLNSR
ncbi:tRNA pseudouridine(55) synthase TruB [Gracilibacillus marinus]|jgi:tRNA pseudouridine55 synthase|uniref:tRNA pseudouridine synthase B n=1 Tax=Gracilibacillus marinus TaxID=630535 RepID=A0ABV8VTC3_9BACI